MRTLRVLLTVLCLSVFIGCGGSSESNARSAARRADFSPKAATAFEAESADLMQAPIEDGADGNASAAEGRKIVYTASLSLVVDDLTAFVAEVRRSVAAAGGFVGDASEVGRVGRRRDANITVRVPSAAYGSLLAGLSSLGEVDSRRESAADVTEQYVDLQARIANKVREETRLVELLEDATGKLTDVLAVEKELSRVRGEIERSQGRLNVLEDQVALSTITISATEQMNYTPDAPRTLLQRMAAAWSNSLGNLGGFFSVALIAVVAFVPWLVIWVPLGVVVLFIVRRVRREIFGSKQS